MIPCNITEESHTDHGVSGRQLNYALAEVREGRAAILVGEAGPAFYIAKVVLPNSHGAVTCALRGPIVGDPPVTEAFEAVRGERPNASRMTKLGSRFTQTLTVIVVGGNLATIYGGPLAPKEVSDPYLTDEERPNSEAFWAVHALSEEG